MRNAMILVVLLVIAALAGVVGFSRPEEPPPPPPRPAASFVENVPIIGGPPRRRFNFSSGGRGGGSMTGGQQLNALLKHYRHSVTKLRATRIATAVADQIEVLRQHLLQILNDDAHDYLAEAVAIAGIVGDKATVSALRRLAKVGPEKIRAKALFAVESITPWPSLELEEFLFGEKKIVLATLQVIGERTADRPIQALIPLLEHTDPEVQLAAIRAFPAKLATTDRDALLRSIDFGSVTVVRNCLRVLGGRSMDATVETAIVDALASPDRPTRLLALDLLTGKKGKLAHPERVWRPEMVKVVDDFEQARALYCLEQNQSANLRMIQRGILEMAVLPRYFAARCLVSAGHKRGIAELLDLLAELEERQLEYSEADPVKDSPEALKVGALVERRIIADVRVLLGRLSRTGPYVQNEEWVEWHQQLGRFAPRRLGPHGISLK